MIITTIKCPYCHKELSRGYGGYTKIPKIWVPFVRCPTCASLIKTGSKEFINYSPQERENLSSSINSSMDIKKSLDRTNNKKYNEFLKKYNYTFYPITEEERERFKNVDFSAYDKESSSASAEQYLYNVGIFVSKEHINEETGEVKDEIISENLEYRNAVNKAEKIGVIFGIISAIIFTSIFLSINPDSYLFLIGIFMGIATHFIVSNIALNNFKNKKRRTNDNSLVDEDISDNDDQEYSDIINENANTKQYSVSNNHKLNISKIKKIQLSVLIMTIIFILFSIIYPITISIIKNSKIPEDNDYKTIKLNLLDSNKKVYCVLKNNSNYLYIKDLNGEIVLYRFYNDSMYNSSNKVVSGKATSIQIKEYFKSNIYDGKPSINYVLPMALVLGLIFGSILLITISILIFLIHRFAEQEIFYLCKNNEIFIKIKNDFKNDEISIYDYKKLTKKLFSQKIMHNNNLFTIFIVIY